MSVYMKTNPLTPPSPLGGEGKGEGKKGGEKLDAMEMFELWVHIWG